MHQRLGEDNKELQRRKCGGPTYALRPICVPHNENERSKVGPEEDRRSPNRYPKAGKGQKGKIFFCDVNFAKKIETVVISIRYLPYGKSGQNGPQGREDSITGHSAFAVTS